MKRIYLPKALALLAVASIALTGCTAAADADGLNSQSPNASSSIAAKAKDAKPAPAKTAAPKKDAKPAPAKTTAPKATAKPAPAKKAAPASKVGPALTGPTAVSVLNKLTVKGKAAATGYDRNGKFGNGWKDFDGDKCDERQEALARDMVNVKFKDAKNCTVASGTLNDLYANKTINWKVKAGSVDIDHVVALKNAWISGAQQLSQPQRQALANDPLNLIASDASANRSKGDRNTAEWLPSNKGFRCQYVATQISVKSKYALAVTAPEKAAMAKVLKSCPTQKAAKVTPIKPGGKATAAPAPAPSKKAPAAPKETTQAPAGDAAKVSGTVNAGSYCKAADKGKKGVSKTNKSYTCKASSSDTRLRWRA